MVAIAMTREMGTLGKDVAQGIADSLSLKVIHSELIEHDLATRLGVEESAVHRYLEGNASLLVPCRELPLFADRSAPVMPLLQSVG